MFNRLIVLLIPFLQVGFTYYISFQSLLIGMLLFTYKYKYIKILGFSTLLLVFLAKYTYIDFNSHDLLLTFREYFGFFLVILATFGLKKINMDIFFKFIKFLYLIIVLSIIIQYFCIHYLNYLPSLPASWYIINAIDEEFISLSIEHGTRLRPFSFFGEPSYAATILVTLNYLIGKFKINYKYDLLALITLPLLESLTGFIVLSLVFFFRYKNVIIQKRHYVFFLVPILIIILSFFVETESFTRIINIFSGEIDSSTKFRLITPFLFIEKVLSQKYYFGISHSEFMIMLNHLGNSNLDNGLLNLFIFYGLGAIVILIYIYIRVNDIQLFLLILLLAQANGAFFSFDKVFIFSIIIGISKQLALLNFKLDKDIYANKT